MHKLPNSAVINQKI